MVIDSRIRSICDDDQGVCPEGHACWLIAWGERGQTARRTCGKPEPGETWPHYVGVPLLYPWIDARQVALIPPDLDPAITEWATTMLAERD